MYCMSTNTVFCSPSTSFNPKSDLSIEYKKLAACLAGEKYKAPFKVTRLFNKVSPKKQEINRDLFYQSIF